jgi:hypothetical protein
MKTKVLMVALVCVMGLTMLSVGNANAGAWYNCTINAAGSVTVPPGSYFVRITEINGAFTDAFMWLDTTMAKEMLASALTAFANSTNVWVYLESTAAYSTAFGLAALK